ncbi:gamma-glutamyl-gamma-aminobutyrate hydrolase family protein [soil metagenome]
MRVALLSLRTERTKNDWFQRELDDLANVATAAVRDLGWEPTLIATGEQPVEQTLAAVTAADAIVVLGGDDVTPAFYTGATDYPGCGHHDPLADEAQIAAVRLAADNSIPLLGICRGAQVINVAFGGTLTQHLPENGDHRIPGPGALDFVEVKVSLEGELGQTLDAEVPVWCGHHQAIDRLGEGLIAVGFAPDGVIEAVVHETAPITGVQWHPEYAEADPAQFRVLLERLATPVA